MDPSMQPLLPRGPPMPLPPVDQSKWTFSTTRIIIAAAILVGGGLGLYWWYQNSKDKENSQWWNQLDPNVTKEFKQDVKDAYDRVDCDLDKLKKDFEARNTFATTQGMLDAFRYYLKEKCPEKYSEYKQNEEQRKEQDRIAGIEFNEQQKDMKRAQMKLKYGPAPEGWDYAEDGKPPEAKQQTKVAGVQDHLEFNKVEKENGFEVRLETPCQEMRRKRLQKEADMEYNGDVNKAKQNIINSFNRAANNLKWSKKTKQEKAHGYFELYGFRIPGIDISNVVDHDSKKNLVNNSTDELCIGWTNWRSTARQKYH